MSKNKHRNSHQQMRHLDQPKNAATSGLSGQPHTSSNSQSTVPMKPESRDFSQMPTQQKSASLPVPSKASPRPTLEQQRAAHALASVRALIPESDRTAPFATEYRSYVEALPATIVMNGLGQECATLLAASNGDGDRQHAYAELHKHLHSWLCRPVGAADRGGVYPGTESLIDAIVQNGQSEYVHAQSEALAYLVWLKKFSQAFLPRRS